MRFWASLVLVLAVMVSACTVPKAPAPGFRDTAQPLSYTTRSDATRLAGEWNVRGYYPGDEGLRQINYLPDWQGQQVFELVFRTCEENGDCKDVGDIWRAKPLGPNRWSLDDPQGIAPRQLWVIWVDESYRTAAIGAPDGTYGWVLDRHKKGGADRIKAAREILDFNGYDIGAMILR